MKATEVTYERLSNQRVGRYENERVAVTVQLDEGEKPQEALAVAKFEVDKALGLLPDTEEVNQALETLRRAGHQVLEL